MKNWTLKILSFLLFVVVCIHANGQNSFVDYQKSIGKVANLFPKTEDTLQKQFEKQKLAWPPNYVYLRSFKYDKQLEVWVKNDKKEPYKLFKTYKVCMQSGSLGPKRFEGDFQVPEGFYHINEFNPNSNYHLALGVSYPNASDKILSDADRPGSAIYIHGNCVSTGCLAISDAPIEELYVLTAYAKSAGQEFVPVHVFPVRYNVKKSAEYLQEQLKANPNLKGFNDNIKTCFDFFETKKQLPIIMVNDDGEYMYN
jgi:murein L,D-transpeptidase YafK